MVFTGLNRFYYIIRIILRYGLSDFIPTNRLTFLFRVKNRFLFRIFNRYVDRELGERFRLALQELGPIWVKFGQMLATRRDIFSNSITDQLEMLQDRVQPFDGTQARMCIEQAIGDSLDTWFENFQKIPLASASIAQVHSARLKKNGKDIVIKVIRPGIELIIKTDINLMYKLTHWLCKLFPKNQQFKFSEIVLEYEKTLVNELNLLKETANTLQLKRNFKSSNILYIPEVYVDFCRKNVMVMERIYGIPMYNIDKLRDYGINMKVLAERGMEIFFTQVFRDSFFHGDMHPGNIFVSYKYPDNPRYISIDCGIVGSVSKQDKYYLAANFIAFFNRDYRKIAELHLDSGWVPVNTNITDFECAIRMVFEPIFEQPLEEISFSKVLLYLFNIARCFDMQVQPQLILLQKTLLCIEGMVRQLYPRLNLWKSSKPFLEKWMKDQMRLSKIMHILKDKMPYWIDKIPELPILLYEGFRRSYAVQRKIEVLTQEIQIQRHNNTKILFLFGVGSILIMSSIFLVVQNQHINYVSVILFILGFIIWLIGWKWIILFK